MPPCHEAQLLEVVKNVDDMRRPKGKPRRDPASRSRKKYGHVEEKYRIDLIGVDGSIRSLVALLLLSNHECESTHALGRSSGRLLHNEM